VALGYVDGVIRFRDSKLIMIHTGYGYPDLQFGDGPSDGAGRKILSNEQLLRFYKAVVANIGEFPKKDNRSELRSYLKSLDTNTKVE
jgi:hypothetical protein